MPDDENVALNRTFAARIVAAYVRRNQVSPDQLGTLFATVHQALGQISKPAEAVSSALIPAVTIRRSVQRDRVTCLDCGWKGQMLRRHLTTAHGLSVEEYRTRWNLTPDHAMTAPSYSERRSTMAKHRGFGRPRGASAETMAVPETEATIEPSPNRRGRPRSKATTTAPA
jgi:MucR family transcriptional regulator, transcriptional regulator of exopolysaccharide biosynthesis